MDYLSQTQKLETPTMNVRLTQEQKIKVLNSADIYAIMQQVLLRENKIRRNQEHFWVVGLNHNNKILLIKGLLVNNPGLFNNILCLFNNIVDCQQCC